jgi:colicin import membrane protein
VSDSSSGAIASPHVEIRVPLDTLQAGLAAAERTVESSSASMSAKMRTGLASHDVWAGVLPPPALPAAIEKVTGTEGETGTGLRGMKTQLRLSTAAMGLMGVEFNRTLQQAGGALARITATGFDPFTIAVVGAIAGVSALVGMHKAAAEAANAQREQLIKLHDELERMRATTHDMETGAKTAAVLPFEQEVRNLFPAACRTGALTASEYQGLGRVAGDDRLAIRTPNPSAEDRLAVAKYNAALDELAEKVKQLSLEEDKAAAKKKEQVSEAVTAYVREAEYKRIMAEATNEEGRRVLALKIEYDKLLHSLKGITDEERKRLGAALASNEELARAAVAAAAKKDADEKKAADLERVRKDVEDVVRQSAERELRVRTSFEKLVNDNVAKAALDRANIGATAEEAEANRINAHYDELVHRAEQLGRDVVDIEQARDDELARNHDKFLTAQKKKDDEAAERKIERARREKESLQDAVEKATAALAENLRQIDMTESERAMDHATEKWRTLRARALEAGAAVEEFDAAYQETMKHLAETHRADEEFWAGFVRGVRDAEQSMDRLGRVGQGVAQDMKTGFEDVFVSFRKGSDDMREAMERALDSITDRLLRFIGDQAFIAVFGKADGNGNLQGGIAQAFANAIGAYFNAPTGGAPALENLDTMEPLTDQQLSQQQAGAMKSARAGGSGDVRVVVNNNTGTPANAKAERKAGPNGDEVHITLEKMMAASVARGGPLTQALETRYPIDPSARVR